jgi:hypothetical protein
MKGMITKKTKLTKHSGRCLCGGIEFEFSSPPNWPHYCCCDDCQKWSGAPAVAWVDFPQASFFISDEKGFLKKYKSSEITHRAFCSNCGSSLFAIDDNGKNMSVTITSLDKPNFHKPESMSYISFAPKWFPHRKIKEDMA